MLQLRHTLVEGGYLIATASGTHLIDGRPHSVDLLIIVLGQIQHLTRRLLKDPPAGTSATHIIEPSDILTQRLRVRQLEDIQKITTK